MKNQTLQWHPTFYAGMQIELCEESENLVFENEHQLGTKPKEIYHVYAYACFYKADTIRQNEISAEDITISFVCTNYPRKLMNHLKTERHYSINAVEAGIYYIEGDFFPIQVICTSRLTDEDNFWLHNLSDRICTKEQALKVMRKYEKHTNENLYESIVNIIISANNTTFKEVHGMCEALKKIYAEEYKQLLEEKDAALKEKDVALKEKDAYILELEKKLAAL